MNARDTAQGSALSSAGAVGLPLIELHDLGVFFRLHRKTKSSMKQMILTRQFRQRSPLLWALRGISLTCHEGQTIGIVGNNGAGKSTLGLVLGQILAPDEGEAIIRGNISALLTLGAGFNSDLSGRANIQLYGAFLGIPRKVTDAKINEIIEFSELAEFIDEPLRHYSSGMRARLGFSVAAMLDPEILILDEVLSVGDRSFQAKSRRRIEKMMSQSKLIVVISHSISFLRDICTRCLWLDHGRMVQFGEASEVLDAYEQSTGDGKKTSKR